MGFEEFNIKPFEFKKFDAGWFPYRNFEEVPDRGSPDCQHVIWFKEELRPFFGYAKHIATAYGGGLAGNGIYNLRWTGLNKLVAFFGTDFVEDVSGTWTSRKGAVTITDGYKWQCNRHIQGSNKWMIGTNGNDQPIKWTGSGNAAAVGGSPPNALTNAYFNRYWWLGYGNDVYYSADTDPDTWNTSRWIFPFPDEVVRLEALGERLVVYQRNYIGWLSGYGRTSFTQQAIELDIGCAARMSVASARYKHPEYGIRRGHFFLSDHGPYFLDSSIEYVEVAPQLNEWWESSDGPNKAYLSKAWGMWLDWFNWYVFALPCGVSTECDTLIVFDAMRGAVWPMPSISANNIYSIGIYRDDNNAAAFYMQDSAGYLFKFDEDEMNYNGSAIQSHWKSKIFDLKGVYELAEPQMYAAESGDYDVELFINFDLASGWGSSQQFGLDIQSDVLSSTFVLGASVLGGKEFIFDSLDLGGYGQFLQFSFKNYDASETFRIYKVKLWMSFVREASADEH